MWLFVLLLACPGGSGSDELSRVRDWMDGATRASEEQAIVETLASLHPSARALVLRSVDLDELVYNDIDDEDLRARLLELIEESAPWQPQVAMISDVDDTALELFFPMDDADARDHFYWQMEEVHFVSGRPRVFSFRMRSNLEELKPEATLHRGSFWRLLTGGFGGMSKDKVQDIERLMATHPGQRFVLVGDDRDRDPEVYREIARRYPDRVDAILIRRAGGDPRDYNDVFFFDNYAQARAYLNAK